jgi:hypothetical protein
MQLAEKKTKPFVQDPDTLILETKYTVYKEMLPASHGDGRALLYLNRSTCGITGFDLPELINLRFKDPVRPEKSGKMKDRF